MSLMDNEKARILNVLVRGKFELDKDCDNYIYASLSQPPIKIINKNGSNDELDFTVECPNCGRYVNYGNEIYMLSGHLYCNEECRKKLLSENDYLRSKYE